MQDVLENTDQMTLNLMYLKQRPVLLGCWIGV